MMTNETKLLTVAMAEALGAMSPECRVKMLRERGLIAPEPVDAALLATAAEVCAQHYRNLGENDTAAGYAPGGRYHRYDDPEMSLTLAALRRGMELAKPELTREQFIDLSAEAHTANGNAWGMQYESFLWEGLHAALQGQSK